MCMGAVPHAQLSLQVGLVPAGAKGGGHQSPLDKLPGGFWVSNPVLWKSSQCLIHSAASSGLWEFYSNTSAWVLSALLFFKRVS